MLKTLVSLCCFLIIHAQSDEIMESIESGVDTFGGDNFLPFFNSDADNTEQSFETFDEDLDPFVRVEARTEAGSSAQSNVRLFVTEGHQSAHSVSSTSTSSSSISSGPLPSILPCNDNECKQETPLPSSVLTTIVPTPPSRPMLIELTSTPSVSSTTGTFPVDFSSTEASLRTNVLLGDVDSAAEVLASSRVVSLGAGLTYPEKLTPFVEPSGDRNYDPDVVAFKAIARSALDTGDNFKLATIAVLSFTPNCACPIFSSEEVDDLLEALAGDFSDKKALQEVLEADANTFLRRRMKTAGKSPVNSFICSSCWPIKQCKKLFWC